MVKSYREINQDALGREKSKKWHRKYRKAVLFALIAVILAVLAYSVAQNALSTAQTNNVFEIVVNNTDLGQTNGTKERIWRTTYYTNSSPIAISLLGHVVGTGAALEMNLNLTVNSTVIQDIDTMTNPGANIHDHASIYFIIPKGSNYSVDNSTGVSYLEWREYPILAGKNGTLSINQTVVSNVTNQSIQITRAQVTGQEAIDSAQNTSISGLQANDTNVSYIIPNLKIGVVSDIHCCEVSGTKWGNNSLSLLTSFVNKMNTEDKPDVIVLLGDYTNEADTLNDLKAVRNVMNSSTSPFYFTRGNHDAQISDTDYKTALGIPYVNTSFDFMGYHFILTNGTTNTRIWYTDEELDWIRTDLNSTNLPAIVFTHQPIDEQNMTGNYYFPAGSENRTNSIKFREILENSRKVIAVFSGHYHWNNYVERNGINYFTIGSIVDSWQLGNQSENTYALARFDAVGTMERYSNSSLGRNYTFKMTGTTGKTAYTDTVINNFNNTLYIDNINNEVLSLPSNATSYNNPIPALSGRGYTLVRNGFAENNIYGFGGSFAAGQRYYISRGTYGNPSNTQNNDCAFIGMIGYGDGYISSSRNLISMCAAENWGASNQGSEMRIGTVEKGTTTRTDKFSFGDSGNMTTLAAGKGYIMKSADGTKCGFLYWGNDDTLHSNAITCP